jgi:NitT/TauT family transport system ATP-binding protein
MLWARDVSKQFWSQSGHRVTALSDVSLSIQEGEFVALLGPSGCGKTTLLRLFAGLDHADGGDLELSGEPIVNPSPEASLVFQSSVLLPWRTVIDNVMLPAEVRGAPKNQWRERALELLASTGLADFAGHYPSELSGGMRQRVSICRALLMDPRVLLMDEPFGALDAITRAQMNKDLYEVWTSTGKTIVFVTHDIAEALRLASRVVVMSPRPGRVASIVDLHFDDASYDGRQEDPAFMKYTLSIQSKIEEFQAHGSNSGSRDGSGR